MAAVAAAPETKMVEHELVEPDTANTMRIHTLVCTSAVMVETADEH